MPFGWEKVPQLYSTVFHIFGLGRALRRLQFQQNRRPIRLQIHCRGAPVVVAENAGAEAQTEPRSFAAGLGRNEGIEGSVGMEESWAGMGYQYLHQAALSGGLQADGLHLVKGSQRRLTFHGLNGKLQAVQDG